jgi:hypothetical protein
MFQTGVGHKKHNFWMVFRSGINYVLKYFFKKNILNNILRKFQALLILKIPQWTLPACPAYTIKLK